MNQGHRKSTRRNATHQGVAMGFVTGLVSGLAAKGYDPTVALKHCGMTVDDLKNPNIRMSLAGYADFYNMIATEVDDEGFDLFSAPLRSGTFEFLTRSAIGASDLRQALERVSRFLRLVLPDLSIVVREEGRQALLEIFETKHSLHVGNDPRRVFAHEWLLRLIHALSCWLIDRNINLDQVSFPYSSPYHSDDYLLIYTANSVFDAERMTARFDRTILQSPIRRTEHDLPDFLQGAPGRIAMLYRRDRKIVRQVRDVIATSLPASLTLEEIAGRLHVSTRSLQRRLSEEKSSLRQIKDSVRREKAFMRLERTRDPISLIAADLGYSDSTAFYRAFHSWAEQSPKEFRASADK